MCEKQSNSPSAKYSVYTPSITSPLLELHGRNFCYTSSMTISSIKTVNSVIQLRARESNPGNKTSRCDQLKVSTPVSGSSIKDPL